MKRSKLSEALQKARGKDVPTPKPSIPTRKDQEDGSTKRFHTSVYLDKQFYGEVKIALIREGQDRDFNELVNDLLRDWLERSNV